MVLSSTTFIAEQPLTKLSVHMTTPRKEVVTIVDKHEYRKLMDFVRKTDPKAFVTVYSVNEMRYSDEIIVVATFFDVSHNSLLKK